MRTSNQSTLPEFQVLILDDGDALITCPKGIRGRCGNGFVVHLETWVHCSDKIGRACPYCFMASRIPEARIIE